MPYQLSEVVDKVENSNTLSTVTLTAVSPFVESSGDSILAKLTFRVKEKKESTVTLTKVNLSNSNDKMPPTILKNINVQIMDLDVDVNDENFEEVVNNFKNTGNGDVNKDGVFNILDVVLVAQLVGSVSGRSFLALLLMMSMSMGMGK